MRNVKYLYVCDKKKCSDSKVCGTLCNHTADISHAKLKKHTHFIPFGPLGSDSELLLERMPLGMKIASWFRLRCELRRR